MLRQPFADARLLLGSQPHTLFGSTPDGVIQAAHPLVLHQIFQLGFIKLVAEIFPEIAQGAGFLQDPLAVAPRRCGHNGGPVIH